MSELNLDALMSVRNLMESRAYVLEYMLPTNRLFQAFHSTLDELMTEDLRTSTERTNQQLRESALDLEKILQQMPEKEAEAEAKMEAMLSASRRRTQALEEWLESLS